MILKTMGVLAIAFEPCLRQSPAITARSSMISAEVQLQLSDIIQGYEGHSVQIPCQVRRIYNSLASQAESYGISRAFQNALQTSNKGNHRYKHVPWRIISHDAASLQGQVPGVPVNVENPRSHRPSLRFYDIRTQRKTLT